MSFRKVQKYNLLLLFLILLLILCAACAVFPSNDASSKENAVSSSSSAASSAQSSGNTASSDNTMSENTSSSEKSAIHASFEGSLWQNMTAEEFEEYWKKDNYGKSYSYQFQLMNQLDFSALQNETIVSLVPSSSRTFLLTESGRVFGVGDGEYDTLQQHTYAPVRWLVEIEFPEKIVMLRATDTDVLAVGESNTLYMWGFHFQQMQKGAESSTNMYTIRFHQPIADVQFDGINIYGGNRVLILTESGEAYAFGVSYNLFDDPNSKTKNGYEWNEKNLLIPQKIETGEKIVQIDVSMGAMFLLGESGSCYTAYTQEDNNYPSHVLYNNPNLKEIDFTDPITKIWATRFSLFVQTENGDVYAAGNNYYGQMGIGLRKDSDNNDPAYKDDMHAGYWVLKKFEKVPLNEKITSVLHTRGWCNTAFLTESGKVYACGSNYNDQWFTGRPVSEENKEDFLYSPVEIPLSFSVTDACSNGYTHFFRAANGSVYVMGSNYYGQAMLADASIKKIETPLEVKLPFAENFTLQ